MNFEVREGSGNNIFILCNDAEFIDWKENNLVFVKNPNNLNELFKIMHTNVIVNDNSFMPTHYLNLIPAKLALEKFLPDFAKGINNLNEISLYEIWEIYNNLVSGISPFLNHKLFKTFKLKTRNDFKNKEWLYDYINNWNFNHIRFFGDVFSIYSILTMRPEYYDDEDLLLNIFYKDFKVINDSNIRIYCLSWTSGF